MSRPAKIHVEHLFKLFGDRPDEALRQLASGASKDQVYQATDSVVAVNDVSFTVAQGEIFVVMGLSGSGKSTLIRCLNRLIEPTGGRIHIDDEDLLAASAAQLRDLRRRKLAMVFQHFALLPHRTVGQNTEYGLKIRGVDRQTRREKALTALEQVGLREWADSMPQQLSGGMQQRVGLARALAADPEVLLMDEPFSALDPLIRRDMQQELLQLQRRMHKTIVFITHDLHEALILGDRIAIMKDGRFVQIGGPEEIVARPADPYVAEFTRDVDRGRVFTLGSVMRPAEPVATTDDPAAVRERLMQEGREAVHVVDETDRPIGLLCLAELDTTRPLGESIRKDFPHAERDARLIDIYADCARGLPVAVLDEQGGLCGRVEPAAVLRELAAETDEHTD